MDKFDRRITEILRSNARASVSEIARAVSLSRTAVTARIQKLEKEKIILGYHADIVAEEKTEQIKAYMALKFDMSRTTQYCEIYADLIYKINQNSDFRFNILGVGTVKASSIRDINLGSYYIANANYRKKLDQGTISLSMKNIFDRPYRTAHRYHTLDRSLFVTYTLDY